MVDQPCHVDQSVDADGTDLDVVSHLGAGLLVAGRSPGPDRDQHVARWCAAVELGTGSCVGRQRLGADRADVVAVGAGGIGLKLLETMGTNSDWDKVAYMVLLILMVVFVFDNLSNALRSRLIGPRRLPSTPARPASSSCAFSAG